MKIKIYTGLVYLISDIEYVQEHFYTSGGRIRDYGLFYIKKGVANSAIDLMIIDGFTRAT